LRCSQPIFDRCQVASSRRAAGNAGGSDREACGAGGAASYDDDRRHADYGATIMPTSSNTMLIFSMVPPKIGAGYAGRILVNPDC
jgi:hypothetical protein